MNPDIERLADELETAEEAAMTDTRIDGYVLPKDVWNNPEFVEEIVRLAAAWRMSPYIASAEMHAVAEQEVRPFVKDILYALEAKLGYDQKQEGDR